MPERHAPRPPVTAYRRRLFHAAGALALGGAVPGCALPVRNAAVPRGLGGRATVLGLPNERFRPDLPNGPAAFAQEVAAAEQRHQRRFGAGRRDQLPRLNLLSISGGGENGAFGAGLLNGWTAKGTRPTFDLVTGVSTGALTAPFAFLGSAWDDALKRVYTDISPERIAVRRWFTAALWNDALADTAPLFSLIGEYVDEVMLAQIADAYQGGRLLLIGSTDIDAQVPVIWNIGAIAASGHPRALDTVRRILLASAAIPGAFPPVLFDVTLEDESARQEMHIDGGAFAQAFLYPAAATQARRDRLAHHRAVVPAAAYVIRNGRLDPEWAATDRRTLTIAGRAVSTMIAASGYNDVLRMYFITHRNSIDFNLAYIGADFTVEFTVPFEQRYMRALYDYGEAHGRAGYAWTRIPPGAA